VERVKQLEIAKQMQRTKNIMLSKRSQMEAFGLAVIVILIIIGFFIVVLFKNNQPKSEPQKEYTNDELATNFVNTIINVNVERCPQYTLGDLLVDCASKKNALKCNSMFSYQGSCYAALWAMFMLTEVTFNSRNDAFILETEGLKWDDSYGNLYIDISDFSSLVNSTTYEIQISNPSRPCTDSMSRSKAGMMPLSLYPSPGTLYLKLSICR
jgi:hypothetical protein